MREARPAFCQSRGPPDELYWSLGPRLAIRALDYKLATDDGKIYRLFDLANDRSEERNLMESKPAVANRLRKKLHIWKDTLPPNNSGWNPKIGPKRPDFGAPQPYHQSLPAPSP